MIKGKMIEDKGSWLSAGARRCLTHVGYSRRLISSIWGTMHSRRNLKFHFTALYVDINSAFFMMVVILPCVNDFIHAG